MEYKNNFKFLQAIAKVLCFKKMFHFRHPCGGRDPFLRTFTIASLYIIIIGILYGNESSANSYSTELNRLLRNPKSSLSDVLNFINNPPNSLDRDGDRAIAVRLLARFGKECLPVLVTLSNDTNAYVRVATILPLLHCGSDSLASVISKREIRNGSNFSFDVAPFYSPNMYGGEWILEIVQGKKYFKSELISAAKDKTLGKMFRLQCAVTLACIDEVNFAKEIAKEILETGNCTVLEDSWARWILRDFRPEK